MRNKPILFISVSHLSKDHFSDRDLKTTFVLWVYVRSSLVLENKENVLAEIL